MRDEEMVKDKVEGMVYDKSPPPPNQEESGNVSVSPPVQPPIPPMPPVQFESIPPESPPGMEYGKTLDDLLETGDLQIQLNREKIHEYDPEQAVDQMSFREAGNFLREKLETSFDCGGVKGFQATLNHFEADIEKGGVITGEVLTQVKNFFTEGRQLKNKEEFKEFWKKAEKFYGTLKLIKKEKGGK